MGALLRLTVTVPGVVTLPIDSSPRCRLHAALGGSESMLSVCDVPWLTVAQPLSSPRRAAAARHMVLANLAVMDVSSSCRVGGWLAGGGHDRLRQGLVVDDLAHRVGERAVERDLRDGAGRREEFLAANAA